MVRLPVHPLLRSRVASIELVDGSCSTYRVLPTSAAVLGLQIFGRLEAVDGTLSPVGVTGLQSGPRQYAEVGATRSILVRFTAQGASCLGVEACELSDRSTPLADILDPSRVAELRERVLGADDDAERLRVVETFLLGLPLVEDRLVAAAIRMLTAPDPRVRVADVAQALGLSERQLERRLVTRVGRTPRAFSSLVRFERAVAMVRAGLALGDVAVRTGYADQPHMNREFRRFAGVSPGRLRGGDGGG